MKMSHEPEGQMTDPKTGPEAKIEVMNSRIATDAKSYERDQYLIAALRKQLSDATACLPAFDAVVKALERSVERLSTTDGPMDVWAVSVISEARSALALAGNVRGSHG